MGGAVMFALPGCGSSSGARDAIVFARGGAEGDAWFMQSLAANATARPLAPAEKLGNVQTAPAAGVWAANRASGTSGAAALAVSAGGKVRNVANEWAWDFALRPDGGAVVYVAGRERRALFTASAPEWQPVKVEGMGDGATSHPIWQGKRVVCVRRGSGGAEVVATRPEGGGVTVLYRARGGRALSNLTAVPGSDDVLVVEAPEHAAPGQLLRIGAGAPSPTVLGEGFFAERGVVVSPDGRSIGAVSGAEPQAVQRGMASLRWLAGAWAGAPAELPGATAAAWSEDGAQLAVARKREGSWAIEVYAARGDPLRPQVLGSAEAPCFNPVWWRDGVAFFQP